MNTTKITIAITVYERVDFFEKALDSALNQTVQCPIIVVDNASSHNRFEEIIQEKNAPNVVYYRNLTNMGFVGNANRCIELCQTEYISILHDDDALHPNFIAHCLSVLNNVKEKLCCVAVSALIGYDSVDLLKQKQSNVNKQKRFKTKHFLLSNLSPFPGILFPVDMAKKLNGFDSNMSPIADYDFWIRLSECLTIYKTNSIYAFYRNSRQQSSSVVFRKVVNKTYDRRLCLYSKGKITHFFSLWNLYSLYLFYLKSYGFDVNISEDIVDVNLKKWFSLFYKTNKGIIKYFYRYSYQIFSLFFLRS